MGLFKLLLSDPISFLILIIPLLYSVVIHEVAHGSGSGVRLVSCN